MRQNVLHVGCGGDPLPAWLGDCDEVRLDIDPAHQPHIVASMVSLGDIGPFDVVVSQHSLEHLFPHDVGAALSEFRRVLRPGGYAFIVVPDLEGIEPTDEVVYHAPCGPITGLDMFYGHRDKLAEMPHMAHRTGFVAATLEKALSEAGFARCATRRVSFFNIIGVGIK